MTATAYSIDELRRANAALQAGAFRAGTPRTKTTSTWKPTGDVVAVIGADRRVATTAVALAIAEQYDGTGSRLIEAGPMHATSLATATTAELGIGDAGWRRGSRGPLLIERPTTLALTPDQLPVPQHTDRSVTVIDVGWDATEVTATDSWLSDAVANATALVVVADETAPGMRSLGTALACLGVAERIRCVLLGPKRRRRPRPVELAAPAALEGLAAAGRVRQLSPPPDLTVAGLTSTELPPVFRAVAQHLAEHLLDHR